MVASSPRSARRLGRQAEVARLLRGVDVRALDEELGKKAGVLLGRSGAEDAVDAALICLAADGDDILTSDPADFRALAEAAAVHVDLVRCDDAADAWAE